MCELGKLPLVICSEYIDTISLSGAIRVNNGVNNNYTTFLSRYNTRSEHLEKSLHEYFHLVKNGKGGNQKEFVPHYVGGGGQPTYPISLNYARVELLKHRPWSKYYPLPTLTDDNTLNIFEEFRNSDQCPLSVNIALERVKNRKERQKRGYVEPTSEDVEVSQAIHPDMDNETKDVVNATNHLMDTTNVFASMEDDGFDIGRNYDWSTRINVVSVTIEKKQSLFFIQSIYSQHCNCFS